MLVPGVDLIGPLLRTQADSIQDAHSPRKLLNHWFQNWHKICSDLPEVEYVMWSRALGGWGKQDFQKGVFPPVHVECSLHSAQGKSILKSQIKEMKAWATCYLEEWHTLSPWQLQGGMQFGNLGSVILDPWKSLFPTETKERTTWERERVLISVC